MTSAPVISASVARRLFMGGQGLLADPGRLATAASVLGEVRSLGFVQVDSINIVERAHHHILWSRLHGYRPAMLDELQRSGLVFEHWTHDASVLPTEVFPHWRARFGHIAWGQWLRRKMGRNHRAVAAGVLERIRAEGPLMARDFERGGRKAGPWWDWKPAKAALEYWWRTGELAIPRRVNFQKVYDLTERVLPLVHALPAPSREEHVEWACRGALERLGAATPKEIAGFWGTVTIEEAREWCNAAVAKGTVQAVVLGAEGSSERAANGVAPPLRRTRKASSGASPARGGGGVAVLDWRERAAALPAAPEEMRLLSPFDPLVRDRARALRLFNFDYRFEAFVPEGKRKHGYYVLPVLRGERLVARLDPRMDREAATLHVRGVWWEGRAGRREKKQLREAVERYGALMGAVAVEMGPGVR